MTKKNMKDCVSSKGKSFAEYVLKYAREGSGRRDPTKNKKSFTMNQI
jgi:hypothetical protein